MARPKIYDEPRVTTAIRLPASLRERLHEAAKARDVSMTLLVVNAISDYLRYLPPLDVNRSKTEPEPGKHPAHRAPS